MHQSPFLIDRKEHGRATVVPTIAITSLTAYFRQMATGDALAVADEWFAVLQIVEASPDGLGIGIFLQTGVVIRLLPFDRSESGHRYAWPRLS